MKKQSFTVAEVLSITTGRLYTEIGGVYKILNHLTGESLMTHHLPVANEFVLPKIKQKLPIELNGDGWEHTEDWANKVHDLQVKYGNIDLEPLTTEEMEGFGEYMVDNSLLNGLGSKVIPVVIK